MKTLTLPSRGLRAGAAGLLVALLTGSAAAQIRRVSDMEQRVGPKNFLQKSLAFDVADHTLEFTGITVLGGQYLFESEVPDTDPEELEFTYFGLYDVTFARKLPNALTYGVNGRLLTRDLQVGSPNTKLDERTEGRFDVYIKGIWGQLSYGDFDDRDTLLISGRNSLAGEANLISAGYLNPSLQRAFRYRARYSSWLVDAAIDEDGKNWDAATQFRTKSGVFERAYAMNYSGGEIKGRYDRHAWSAGHELLYGSWDFALGVTWEYLTPQTHGDPFDRVIGSLGVSWKRERLTVAAGVLLGEVNDSDLGVVATAGARYDILRGLSLNAGYIHADTEGVATDGVPFGMAYLSGFRFSVGYRF